MAEVQPPIYQNASLNVGKLDTNEMTFNLLKQTFY